MEYGYARASTNSDKQDTGRQKREVIPKGYVILDESGSERTVGCCIPNITLYAGQMVWVKIPMGDIKGMYICNVVESRRMRIFYIY